MPLVSSLGYNNRGPADTNMFVVRPENDTFPHAVPHFPAQRWVEAVLPSVRMSSGNCLDGLVNISELTFRTIQHHILHHILHRDHDHESAAQNCLTQIQNIDCTCCQPQQHNVSMLSRCAQP